MTGPPPLLPPIPPDLAALVGSAAGALARYAGWLAGPGLERGLLGPRELPRIWDRHIVNCAAVAPLLPAAVTVIDVGSGAGLPGLVLAIVRPDLQVTLLDATARRTVFLAEVVADLELSDRVAVATGRAEDAAVRAAVGPADVAVSRALAPLDRLVGWCLPLTTDGGTVLAMKGSTARTEVERTEPMLRRLGAVVTQVHDLNCGGQTTTVVEVRRRSR